MPELRSYVLIYEQRRNRWSLEDERNGRQVRTFRSKGQALSGDALRRALGTRGGIVNIEFQSGRLQEQRIYHRQ